MCIRDRYFGSAQALNREHLKRLKELTRRTRTPWLSDHLCWGSVDGRYTHDLLPLPYTFEAVSYTHLDVYKRQTWGKRDGFPAVTRLVIGQHTTQQEFDTDWIVTHELVHMALASLPDSQHWLEEGIATYVEPIARSQAGQLGTERVWADMLGGMWHGEPKAFDRGLDHTHTWGRTYWGGALFCLVADIEIRRQTDNTYGRCV